MNKLVLMLMVCLALVGTAQAERILMDFGAPGEGGVPTTSPDSNGLYWNNQPVDANYMNFSLQQITAPGGVDTANNALPNFAVWTYNCAGSGGTGVVDSTLYPSTAQQDFIFMDGSYNNGLANALLVAIVGLPSSNYDVKLFGSRITPGAGRVGTYLVNGQTQTLDAYANTSNTITFANVPVGDVTIGGVVEHNAILLTCYVTGTNYGYLSVADLNAVPEPATMGLLILGALAALRRRR